METENSTQKCSDNRRDVSDTTAGQLNDTSESSDEQNVSVCLRVKARTPKVMANSETWKHSEATDDGNSDSDDESDPAEDQNDSGSSSGPGSEDVIPSPTSSPRKSRLGGLGRDHQPSSMGTDKENYGTTVLASMVG